MNGFWRRLALLLLMGLPFPAGAVIQFDVFLGYDGVVPEASWFPLVCEVKNDGPTFTGVIEVQAGNFNQSQTRRVVVELPTGTLKRVVVPVFSTARYQSSWEVRLLDERGKLRAEQPGARPKRQVASQTMVLGSLPRTINGVPMLREVLAKDALIVPASARLQAASLPDNPLVLEGLDSLYLNSEKALELKDSQVDAIKAWLSLGGHLIIGVEQVADANSSWLRTILPCELTGTRPVTEHADLQRWVRNPSGLRGSSAGWANPFATIPEDRAFESAELQVAVAKPRNGQVLAQAGDLPLIVSGSVGRGQVTALLFSPEREPVKSWKNLSSFWAKMAAVPPELYTTDNQVQRGGWSVDGIFGAMIDSKQVRKLPVEWLLVLLLVYLVVIGPLDQYWLKRIRRPMLTWITFPCYVVMFSLLIYFIGYKLRAGESEWNELHLVDVMRTGTGSADLRGRTFASIYSPVNSEYKVESQAAYATFRGEFASSWSGGQEGEKADIWQNGDNFKAKIFVPVWTSQLYISDWWQAGDAPVEMQVSGDAANLQVAVNNRMDRPLTHAQLVVGGRIYDLGGIARGQTKKLQLGRTEGRSLKDFVAQHAGGFQSAAQSRQQAFGGNKSGRIENLPDSCAAVSFLSQMSQSQSRAGFDFIAPPGLDLTPVIERGQAVLLAWANDFSPIRPLNQFSPRRSHKDTLWRLAVPVTTGGAP